MTTVTIDDVVVHGANRAEENAGWQAPEATVDRGADYSSFVRTEPRELVLEANITSTKLRELEQIRQRGEPFPASVGQLGLPEAKLQDLSVTDTGDNVQPVGSTAEKGFDVDIRLREVHFAETDTAEVQFNANGDEMSSSAEDSQASNAGSEEESNGLGVVDSLESAANSLSSTLLG